MADYGIVVWNGEIDTRQQKSEQRQPPELQAAPPARTPGSAGHTWRWTKTKIHTQAMPRGGVIKT
jgi:hypothetical protein